MNDSEEKLFQIQETCKQKWKKHFNVFKQIKILIMRWWCSFKHEDEDEEEEAVVQILPCAEPANPNLSEPLRTAGTEICLSSGFRLILLKIWNILGFNSN